ncbi:MAG TPA: SUF system NifU family Fe-S cluster assembly protein [Burkholderiaceae bacterium]
MSTTTAESELYQEVVVDHKRAPRNFGTLPAPTHQARGNNPQCGDDLQVALCVERGQVRDIRFTGQGCAICIASASMMTEAVRGRDVAVAQQLQQRFRAVLTGQLEPEAAQLGKLISLGGVRRYPSRIKCALLGWHALMHALMQTSSDSADAAPATEPAATAATP